MAKFLTKEQVVANFKLNYANQVEKSLHKRAWGLLLDSLLADKKISEKQRKVWKFPEKELYL